MISGPREGYDPEWNDFEQSEGDLLPYPPDHPKFNEGFNQTLIKNAKTFPPPAAGITARDEQVSDHVRVRIYQPPRSTEDSSGSITLPLVVFYHGGGWITGDLDTEDYDCRRVCGDAGVVVVSVDYRKAPMFLYPALIEDCHKGFEWAHSHASELGADPTRYLVWGGSAGGGLAISVTHKLVENGEDRKLAGLISIGTASLYPNAIPPAYAHLHTSHKENRDVPFVTGAMSDIVYELIGAAPPHDEISKHWFPMSMGVEGVKGFPPTWIANSGKEHFRDDGLVLETELKDVGVRVKRVVFEGLPHYHWTFPLPKASEEFRRSLVEEIKWVLDGE